MKTIKDDYIETYGLKSARRKQRLKYWDYDKHLLRMEKEAEKLWYAKHRLGWIELEKPVQRGWRRYYVLREDIAKGSEGAFYQGILDKINTVVVCNRKDFMNKNRKTKKMNPIPQQPKRFSVAEFNKLNFTSKQKDLFELRRVGDPKYMAFVYTREWQFDFRIKKNIVTHIVAHDAVLDKRIAELDKVVYGFANRNRLANLHGKGVYKFWKDCRWAKGEDKLNKRLWDNEFEAVD